MPVLAAPAADVAPDWEMEAAVDDWVTLAGAQKQQQPHDVLLWEGGDQFAFEDRNCFLEEQWRRIFVTVLDDEKVVLHDEHGNLIDDRANFTPGGIQNSYDGDRNFQDEWNEGYYRMPVGVAAATLEVAVGRAGGDLVGVIGGANHSRHLCRRSPGW